MKQFKIKSHAKINIALNVTGKNSKLHNIESIITFINLHDLIIVKQIDQTKHKISFKGKFSKKISKKKNTISALLMLLDEKNYLNDKKFNIKIIKNIPQSPFNQSTKAPDDAAKVVRPAVPIEANKAY